MMSKNLKKVKLRPYFSMRGEYGDFSKFAGSGCEIRMFLTSIAVCFNVG